MTTRRTDLPVAVDIAIAVGILDAIVGGIPVLTILYENLKYSVPRGKRQKKIETWAGSW